MNSSGTGATFREWSNLACLASTAVIYPVMLVRGMAHPSPYSLAFLLMLGVVIQVGVLIGTHILVAMLSREEPDDERVRSIEHRAARLGGGVMGLGVFMAIGFTLLQSTVLDAPDTFVSSPLMTGYVLFGVVFCAELLRMVIVAVGYRTA